MQECIICLVKLICDTKPQPGVDKEIQQYSYTGWRQTPQKKRVLLLEGPPEVTSRRAAYLYLKVGLSGKQ